MGRLKVTGAYEGEDFVIKDESNKEELTRISPREMFEILSEHRGKTITTGNFFARQIRLKKDGPQMIAIHRLDEANREHKLTLEQLQEKYTGVKGELLHEGLALMATNVKSAQNGFWHRFHAAKDALERAMDELRLGRKILRRVKYFETIKLGELDLVFSDGEDSVVNGEGESFSSPSATYVIHCDSYGNPRMIYVTPQFNPELVAQRLFELCAVRQ